MDKIIEFIGNNYAWFLTISIILLFALIGYIVDTKRNKNDIFRQKEEELDENYIEEIKNSSENTGKSLSDMVTKSKNINPETKGVELIDNTIVNAENTNTDPNNEIIDNKVQ